MVDENSKNENITSGNKDSKQHKLKDRVANVGQKMKSLKVWFIAIIAFAIVFLLSIKSCTEVLISVKPELANEHVEQALDGVDEVLDQLGEIIDGIVGTDLSGDDDEE